MSQPIGWSTQANQTRLEDLTFMAATGEHAEGAAHRLGLSYAALDKWAHRNAPDLWRTLLARNPCDPNYRTAGRNQHTAA